MSIQRDIKRIEIGPNRVRYRVVITGDDCPPQTHEGNVHQALFLNWLAENQNMLACGYERFQKMTIHHNGKQWVAEVEADVDESTE